MTEGSTTVHHVRDRSTFVDLRRRGRRTRHGPITVSWVAAPDDGPPRVAYAIGRLVGSSVARNRLRRRLRALVREHAAAELRTGAYLIGAGPDAAGLSHAELGDALVAALRALTAPAGMGSPLRRGGGEMPPGDNTVTD